MERNIMLLFVSRPIWQGSAEPKDAVYQNIKCGADADGKARTRTTNESAVRYLLDRLEERGASLEKIFAFVSDSVRKRNEAAGWSGLEYFQSRLYPYLPDIAERFVDVPYDESLQANDTLEIVIAMAEQIQAYAGDISQGDEVVLHVDLTGGMRHANMLMLGVVRLLQYGGVKIGRMLYSNYNPSSGEGRVEEADEIYKLFDLISGTEEFVRFGSVDSILAYYQNRETDAELAALLDAMKNFAGQIKLCHYGDFKEAADRLREAERNFEKAEKNRNSRLFHQLTGTLEKEYRILLDREPDDLELIEWCLQRGHIQQALTLYTERVPEYICENKLIEQTPEEHALTEKLFEKDELHRSVNFCLFNEYEAVEGSGEEAKRAYENKKFKTERSIDDLTARICDEIADMLRESLEKEVSKQECFDRIDRVLSGEEYESIFKGKENIFAFLAIWQKLKSEPQLLRSYPVENPFLQRFIEVYLDEEAKSVRRPEKQYRCIPYGKKRYTACFVPFVKNNMDRGKLPEICNFQVEKKYPSCGRLRMLRKYHRIFTRLPFDELQQIYEDYAWVKRERIHSNHAKGEKSSQTVDSLQKQMRGFLQRLREAKGKVGFHA